MLQKKSSWVSFCIGVAREILNTRELRRKILLRLVIGLLALVILGASLLAGFLASEPWLFMLWWFFVFFLTLVVILFALYEILMTLKEEKEK